MNCVILGAGSLGSYLATLLSQEEHNVILIDNDRRALEKIARTADVATRIGSGTDWLLFEELLDLSPDFFLALTPHDETNLTACSIAKNLGFPKTVARIRNRNILNRARLDFSRLFFVDVFLGTDLIISQEIIRTLQYSASHIESFAHGTVEMRTLHLPEKWRYAGKSIADLRLPENLLIALIHRHLPHAPHELPQDEVIFPKGSDRLMDGDEITLIGETKALQDLSLFGVEEKPLKTVGIVGGSQIALTLARLLDERGIEVRLVEEEEERCRELAEQLPHIAVLNHPPSDLHFLLSERLDQCDAFVAATASHETNLLLAALALEIGCPQVVPLLTSDRYLSLLPRLGIHTSVSYRDTIAQKLLTLIQRGSMLSATSLCENRVKLLEVRVSPDSKVVGVPLSDLRKQLPKDLLFALIESRGEVAIPKGNHILAPGDTAILLCRPADVAELRKVF